MTMHGKADAQMARKYGADAWEWMPYWGKVRNRLEQRIYDRYHHRMLILSAIVPSVIASVACAFTVAICRGALGV